MKKAEILKRKLGEYKKLNKEFLFSCVNKNCRSHLKNKLKLSLNFEKNIYHCWVCEISGPIKKIVSRYNHDIDFINEWMSVDNTYRLDNYDNLFKKEEVEKKQVAVELPLEFSSLVENNSISAITAKNYLYQRGLTEKDIYYWKPGYCSSGEFKNRIIFPSFDSLGRINFYQGRTYAEDRIPYIKANINSKDIIFNELYVNWDKPVILVEGIFDAVVVGDNGIPILGSALNEKFKLFREIVKNNSVVYLALDPDAAEKEYKIAEKLHKYEIIVYKIDVKPYKDIGEMSRKEFLKRKSQAKLMKPSIFIDKLENILQNKLGGGETNENSTYF